MILLVGGAACSGTQKLAQALLERYYFPYTSLEHLKTGICSCGIPCGFLSSDPDLQIAQRLWGVTQGILRACLQKQENLILEGRYLPPEQVAAEQSEDVIALYLTLSERYLRANYTALCAEEPAAPPLEQLIAAHAQLRDTCRSAGLPCTEIQEDFEQETKALLHALQPRLIRVRPYRPSDLPVLMQLFYDTIHTVCRGDYTDAQLAAWAPREQDAAAWAESLRTHDTRVAEIGGRIVGFGDLTGDYLDRLYVDRRYQRLGIGTAIADALEQAALDTGVPALEVHASRPARPFFEKRGYQLVRPQHVTRRGETLLNYILRKPFIEEEPEPLW